MSKLRNSSGYAPPISLRDLVEILGVDLLGAIVARLPGAVPLEPKHNETWRFVIGEAVVLGYRASATVTGLHSPQLRQTAAAIRAACEPSEEEQAQIGLAVDTQLSFVQNHIAIDWHQDQDADALHDLLTLWLALSSLARALAFAELKRRIEPPASRPWYVQTMRLLLLAHEAACGGEREAAYDAAYDDGYDTGYDDGYVEGHDAAYDAGRFDDDPAPPPATSAPRKHALTA